MRPSKTVVQQRDSRGVHKAEADNDESLMFSTHLYIIVSFAAVGLGALIGLSFFLSKGRIPFIVGAALPLFTLIAIIYQAIIYRRQWRVMRDTVEVTRQALQIGNKAYVGVHSLESELEQERIILLIENTGNVPAENVDVSGTATVLIPKADAVGLSVLRNIQFDTATCYFHGDFWRLNRGNLKGRVIIDLFPITLNGKHYLPSVAHNRGGIIIVEGQIEYGDGFEYGQVARFAFNYDPSRGWTARPVDRSEEAMENKDGTQNPEKANPN